MTKSQVEKADIAAVVEMIESWKTSAYSMASNADTYVRLVTLPGGQEWSGVVRDAMVTMVGKDRTAVINAQTLIDAMADCAKRALEGPVAKNLEETRAAIAEATDTWGFDVDEDLSVTDPWAFGQLLLPDNERKTALERLKLDIPNLAQAWWESEQAVATQIAADRKALSTAFNWSSVLAERLPDVSPEDAEQDVRAALGGDRDAAARVNAILDSISEEQKAGREPLTPGQAAVLSQLQAQQNGMSQEALNAAEEKLGDLSRMIPNSWALMSNGSISFPKTPLTVGAKQSAETVTGGFAQLPRSIQSTLISQPGGEARSQSPSWEWDGKDYALTSATAVKAGVLDAAGRAFLTSPGTGPGRADAGMIKWFADPRLGDIELKGFTRANGVLAAALVAPAIISDVADGDSVLEATTREVGGAAVGIWAGVAGGAWAGGVAGSFIPVPGVGTAVGIVAGAVIGGVAATGASKAIGNAWDWIFD